MKINPSFTKILVLSGFSLVSVFVTTSSILSYADETVPNVIPYIVPVTYKNDSIDSETTAFYYTINDNGQPGWVQLSNGAYKYRNEDMRFASNTSLAIDGDTYRFDDNGVMITGWWSADNGASVWYYYYPKNNTSGRPEGSMAVNTDIEGYHVNYLGVYSKDNTTTAKTVLDQVGWNLKAAYDWSAGLKYYSLTDSPERGINWFADYGFTNNYGNCYVMAATFVQMARELGYEASQMDGIVPSRKGGTTPHSWCELIIDGQTHVFDPNFTNETGKDGYDFSYGKSGTWRYQSYRAMHD